MPIRGPIDSSIPAAQQPIGYVTIDGKKVPVQIDESWRRHLETEWQRSGGFIDETFDADAIASDLLSQIQAAELRIEALEQIAQQDRAIDAAIEELQTRLAAIESLPTIQENADVSGQIEALQLAIRSVEEDLFSAPRGIDVVTNADVDPNADISPTKLKTITAFTEDYTNTTITNVQWDIIMKLKVGGAARANQFFLDGSAINMAVNSADDTGTFNWEAKIHATEPTVSADRSNSDSTVVDSGSFAISTGAAPGSPSIWSPGTQFYSWRNNAIALADGYPTEDSWIVFWGFIGTGPATEAYMGESGVSGLNSRIEFTSAFGFDEVGT